MEIGYCRIAQRAYPVHRWARTAVDVHFAAVVPNVTIIPASCYVSLGELGQREKLGSLLLR